MRKAPNNHSAGRGRNESLPKTALLRGRKQFQRLFEGPITVFNTAHISLRFYRCEEDKTACKMGFIVPKRLGKAVSRNYIKRILKETYRLNKHDFTVALKDAETGFHGAFLAKTLQMDFKMAEKEVVRLMDHLINELDTTRRA